MASDSTGGINVDGYTDSLTANIPGTFYECEGPYYVPDGTYYHYDFSQEADLLESYHIDNHLNIYHFASVSFQGGGLCGYSYLPPSRDVIVLAIGCGIKTMVHEAGHYFTLFHTHGKTNFGTTDELVDGSNCTTAGDDICDTPADPNLFGS